MLKRFINTGLISLICLITATEATTFAQEALSPRLQIGINLLPAVIAANQSLPLRSDSSNPPIYLVYRSNRHLAQQIQSQINQLGLVKKHGLDAVPIALDELLGNAPQDSSAVFIAEQLDDDLPRLLAFAEPRRILVFSPYKGDVERGVTSGFRVTDRVLPLVNMATLRQTKIQLKAFFLRVAVKHE